MQKTGEKGLILGIESSCDETSAAVVGAGFRTLSNIVASQMALHANYGGVVPELASREHLRNVVPVVREAMKIAGVSYDDLDAIAVTEGPGLAGALLVGITFAKALALGLEVPLIGVNHLEGHIHAVLMDGERKREEGVDGERKREEGEGRLLALVVSGGHTHLYLAAKGGPREGVERGERDSPHISEAGDGASARSFDGLRGGYEAPGGLWGYRNVGQTVDDAAGEAFDKVAKLLGLGYPGGPWIDALAACGDPKAVKFSFAKIKTREFRPGTSTPNKKAVQRAGPVFDFSFSGIKTAVLRYVEMHGMRVGIEERRAALAAAPEMKAAEAAALCDEQTLGLIASFQAAVVGNLMRQTFAAAEAFGVRRALVSGGVAANRELRQRFLSEAARRGMAVEFPSVAMSTDNAAMIAAAAWGKYAAGEFAGDDLVAAPQLKLG